MTREIPYGSWPSPLSAARVARQAVRLGEPRAHDDTLFWLERRPHEAGRTAVVAAAPGSDGWSRRDLLPAPFNARNRVHEYGGGSYCIGEESLFFVDFGDQRIWRTPVRSQQDDPPAPLTARSPAGSFADLQWDGTRQRLVAIRERYETGSEPVSSVVAVDLDGRVETLASGHDFFSSPRLDRSGGRLAWLSWDHPHMPWDSTRLWLAELDADGCPREPRCIAGGPEESIFQPAFSPDGRLHFVSDRTGWWNLYRLEEDGRVTALAPRQAEFGLPHWVFAMSTYAIPSADRLVCTWCEGGIWKLGDLDLASLELQEIEAPFTLYEGLAAADAATLPAVVLLASSPVQGPTLCRYRLDLRCLEEIHRSTEERPDPRTTSLGEPIEFPTPDGARARAFFYPPHNEECAAPADDRPPLLVLSHGGPTAMSTNDYDPAIQFWTSRGFAVVDVNYGGSTGFGREYRRRLDGRWGIVDVDDCCAAARFLVERGEADPERLAIRGGSAGGYTTLAALAFRDLFRAGASRYGVGDLTALARDTHKFEARYLDRLIGPWPEAEERYRERSPIRHPERLSCPVIFFQGLQDKVVPPNQAETMVAALRAKGIPVAYVSFEQEQHGFRRAENIERALEAELWFYSRIFGFELAEEVEPVEIHNLERSLYSPDDP